MLAYLTALDDVTAPALEGACKALGLRQRKEFESAFPDLGTILSEARRVQSDLDYQTAMSHAMPMPVALPMTDAEREARSKRGAEMRDNFLADLRAMIASKRMPKASAPESER